MLACTQQLSIPSFCWMQWWHFSEPWTQCLSMVLKHTLKAGHERLRLKSLRRSTVHWTKESPGVEIAKWKQRGDDVDVGDRWEVKEQRPALSKSQGWHEERGQIRQAKGTPINTSWLPQGSREGDRSRSEGFVKTGQRVERRQPKILKTNSVCNISCWCFWT